MIEFTRSVGVAPATTTMQMNGLGICPPGYFGPPSSARFTPSSTAHGSQTVTTVNPYGTESKLAGLGQTSRAPLFALAFGLAFVSVVGFALYKGKPRGKGKRLSGRDTVRVYFAETARTRNVQVTPEVWRKLRELKKDGDTYMASTRNDYLALRPYVRDED
jgi:hypothetical protein